MSNFTWLWKNRNKSIRTLFVCLFFFLLLIFSPLPSSYGKIMRNSNSLLKSHVHLKCYERNLLHFNFFSATLVFHSLVWLSSWVTSVHINCFQIKKLSPVYFWHKIYPKIVRNHKWNASTASLVHRISVRPVTMETCSILPICRCIVYSLYFVLFSSILFNFKENWNILLKIYLIVFIFSILISSKH